MGRPLFLCCLLAAAPVGATTAEVVQQVAEVAKNELNLAIDVAVSVAGEDESSLRGTNDDAEEFQQATGQPLGTTVYLSAPAFPQSVKESPETVRDRVASTLGTPNTALVFLEIETNGPKILWRVTEDSETRLLQRHRGWCGEHRTSCQVLLDFQRGDNPAGRWRACEGNEGGPCKAVRTELAALAQTCDAAKDSARDWGACATLAWFKRELQFTGTVGEPASTDPLERAKSLWTYEIGSVEGEPLSIGWLLVGIAVFIFGLVASRRITRLISRRVSSRFELTQGVTGLFDSIGYYALLVTFTLLALNIANVPLTVFALFGGALAIGVGFGSQNIVNNFISGIIMMIEQPVAQGDLIEVEGTHGTVEHMGPRSTIVRTVENTRIVVPNSTFLEQNIVNWTLTDNTVRGSVVVGVAYGSDLETVRATLFDAAMSQDRVLKRPSPLVLFTDFGDSALNFELVFWMRMATLLDRRTLESDMRFTIDRMCREQDISIAFPQLDVHFDPGVLRG